MAKVLFVLLAAVALVGCGPGRTHPYCGAAHSYLPPGIMTDQQWRCISTGEPLSVIKTLYPGVALTDDGLVWRAAAGNKVYLATLACSSKDDVGDCSGPGRKIKTKKVYSK